MPSCSPPIPALFPPNEGEAMARFRRELLGHPEKPGRRGPYDLVVVGGGMAGTCAAVSAARLGLSVALIQDRPLLGGNNSSEIRVHLHGRIHLPPYPALGGIVNELGRTPSATPGRPSVTKTSGNWMSSLAEPNSICS
jgi:NADPH-dependent 2,4-dienoyl-CoA reductase/sulfur reductase-like enzyme